MSARTEKIAGLYFETNTLRVDLVNGFKLSLHKDHPELPNSPWYMHYDDTKPGAHLLPELYSTIGEEFYDMALALGYEEGQMVRIAGLPNGAKPIGKEFARRRDPSLKNHLEFFKIQHPDDRTEFTGPLGEYNLGDELLPTEDHVSAARNNLLFAGAIRRRAFFMRRLFAVVDRQQGATQNLAEVGIDLHSIHTGDSILEVGLAEGHVTQAEFDEVQSYRAANQFSLAGLQKAVQV